MTVGPNARPQTANTQPTTTETPQLEEQGGLPPADFFSPEQTKIVDMFLAYARESYTGYTKSFNGYKGYDDDRAAYKVSEHFTQQLKDAGREREVSAFPAADVLHYPSGYLGRAYVLGKYGNPSEVHDSDRLLTLCEDGNLRTISVADANNAMPPHEKHRPSKIRLMMKFAGRSAVSHSVETPDRFEDSTALHLGNFGTNEHLSLKFIERTGEKALVKTLEAAIGRNFHHNTLR